MKSPVIHKYINTNIRTYILYTAIFCVEKAVGLIVMGRKEIFWSMMIDSFTKLTLSYITLQGLNKNKALPDMSKPDLVF